ncbi:hypothetical protein W97_00537 [Coniosporium apollinis CBS 100218]|uniref:Uncharacterized protein n=1 Tax=Coniosporium apollinis (strain CBS 100218) TaxID=1168221 RepID=R7YHN9_CONA1|nr:uncharacterized protein W97_00537 [Coniosporium apollinis CBS 100218]EON61324.1 hypothetical protein W97_00537 [Coniosporium apollinis CBS 100218]
MADAAEACQREYDLYPVAEVQELVTSLYGEMIPFLEQIIKLHGTARSRFFRGDGGRHEIQDSTVRVRKISQKIIREVEYLHRREMREAHLRLQDVERKQITVLQVMEAQQKILISLQEEQKIMAVISDQQKILQMLQQLQMRFPQSTKDSGADAVVV